MMFMALATSVGSGVPALAAPVGTAMAMGALVIGLLAFSALVIWWRAS